VQRADCPVAKLDFVNAVAAFGGVGSTEASQPANGALFDQGAVHIADAVMVCTRELVDETLRNSGLYASEDLVEQGNTLPLIPLNIDPPAHVGYRKLLDPLFAPRRVDALEADITERANHFIGLRGHVPPTSSRPGRPTARGTTSRSMGRRRSGAASCWGSTARTTRRWVASPLRCTPSQRCGPPVQGCWTSPMSRTSWGG
jgi:hypothetical protein